MSMKNSNDTIGNRTSDLLTCSTVPQPTAPPRSPIIININNNNAKINNNYWRLQDLIQIFKIPMGTRKCFFGICRKFGQAPSWRLASPAVQHTAACIPLLPSFALFANTCHRTGGRSAQLRFVCTCIQNSNSRRLPQTLFIKPDRKWVFVRPRKW